jgi:phage terminase small subunit
MKYKKKPEPYLDSYGKRVFQAIITICEGYGVEIDSIGASIMAQLLSIFNRASAEANKQGITLEGDSMDRQHPSVRTALDASSKWLSYAREYGIPTAARARIFKQVEKYELSDAIDRLVVDDSRGEFDSEPQDWAKKKNMRTIKNLKNGGSS